MKPMLAAQNKAEEVLEKLRFPVYATPKLDGIRALIFPDGVRSRSLKPIPHAITQGAFREPELVGLDGELIVGSPTAQDSCRRTQAVVSKKDSPEIATFHVFDTYEDCLAGYEQRISAVKECLLDAGNQHVKFVYGDICKNLEALLEVEEAALEEGYEGLILRAPNGLYKHGRSTLKEQGMVKLKRFYDGEAEVIGTEEEMHNANEAKTNALGRTERSSHKANLVGKGTMGALVVRDVQTKVQFKIGGGFTAADRAAEWPVGTIVKYKYFKHGVKDKPRHSKYVARRDSFDR